MGVMMPLVGNAYMMLLVVVIVFLRLLKVFFVLFFLLLVACFTSNGGRLWTRSCSIKLTKVVGGDVVGTSGGPND
jgi:hypothetical protein